jgi:lipoyl(octanoyl) transferase
MPERPLWVVDLGTVAYDDAVAIQERVHAARLAGEVPDVLLFVQHPAVITLGRAARQEHLLVDAASLEARGIQVRETARGGDVTYHGPGQVVGYPILHLDDHGRDVHEYLRGVEEALIRLLAGYSLVGARIPKLTGVWVGNEKVAAIGIGVRRWVTWHGFALNVTTDLDAFGLIVPCGIRERGVTSLARLLGREVPEAEIKGRLAGSFGEVFSLSPEEITASDLLRRV